MQLRSVVAGLMVLSGAAGQALAQAKTAKAAAPLKFVVTPTGNEARYRVREQLVGVDLPNDAVGITHDITGQLMVQPNGTVIADSSKITVSLTNLKSDKARRDTYIKTHSVETTKFPTVQLVPRSFPGLAAKPGNAPMSFSMIGDLMVHGVTHPTTWKVTAHADGNDVVGTASTQFTFKDFGIDQPSVAVVLAVEDTIKLEYDFRFAPAKTP